ncbi:hypothetical protein CUMW_224930 [Citrus unshiu]|uniref:Uncharacterized protein n=1 Tax=Citrus unshiu TaxID=55188 RepID=A0A2H5QFG9_CITUN|nr:hypothetical protein CUMW_224930 [Citrus unshiu]
MEEKIHRAHVLIVPYPSQGHINPTFQFAKRLASRGLKITLALTNFIYKSTKPSSPSGSVQIDTISDGYDDGDLSKAESIHAFFQNMEVPGSKTLAELITKFKSTSNPIDCVIYDAFLYWALDVAKGFGLFAAAFFTQTCAVNFIYYLVHHGLLKLPVPLTPVSIPGLPLLELQDMPSFIGVQGQYSAYFEMVLNQFSNADRADLLLVNTFYELESVVGNFAITKTFSQILSKQVADSMAKSCPVLTIPESKRQSVTTIVNSSHYTNPSASIGSTKSPRTIVVIVAFGKHGLFSQLNKWKNWREGLKKSSFLFSWVIRRHEGRQYKAPKGFVDEMAIKVLIVIGASR